MSEPSSLPQYEFRSRLRGPISELSRLRVALLFAELSKVAYYPPADVIRILEGVGVPDVEFYDRDGAQAFRFENDRDVLIVCRGTEPHDINDLKADVNVLTVAAETMGRVHRGFKREVDDLWPMIEKALAHCDKTVWFAGHSLGGAMATVCAGRCFVSPIRATPQGLCTFGSPRVGDRRYINFVKLDHVRWVNNNDLVTRLPPAWFGYRHAGQEMYINSAGELQKLTGLRRSLDRLRGILGGLRQWRLDPLSDHAIDAYIAAIHDIVQRYEGHSDE